MENSRPNASSVMCLCVRTACLYLGKILFGDVESQRFIRSSLRCDVVTHLSLDSVGLHAGQLRGGGRHGSVEGVRLQQLPIHLRESFYLLSVTEHNPTESLKNEILFGILNS